MNVIRLPTAARAPVRNPPACDTAPRLMCEAAGFLRAVRAAMIARPDIPRRAFIAAARVRTTRPSVNALDIIRVACARPEENAA